MLAIEPKIKFFRSGRDPMAAYLRRTFLLTFVLGLASNSGSAFAQDDICACRSQLNVKPYRQGSWFIAESDNFQVCSLQSQAQAEEMARHCEKVRDDIAHTWCDSCDNWRPKCQVILHGTKTEYVKSVGPGSEMTFGSSLVRPARGRVQSRRIDLRVDVNEPLVAALPHELCHVVLADHFREGLPPLWFDEGVAIQYDPKHKQVLHERDFARGLSDRCAYSPTDLITLGTYPPPARWGVFYGQSASLVRWLLTRHSAPDLLRCVVDSRSEGSNLALREHLSLRDWKNTPSPAELISTAGRPFNLVSVNGFTRIPTR